MTFTPGKLYRIAPFIPSQSGDTSFVYAAVRARADASDIEAPEDPTYNQPGWKTTKIKVGSIVMYLRPVIGYTGFIRGEENFHVVLLGDKIVRIRANDIEGGEV